MKYLRDYELTIQRPPTITKQLVSFGINNPNVLTEVKTFDDIIVIKPPFSLTADVERSTLADANKGSFTIYNLAPDTRNQIYKDRYNTVQQWQLELKVGYDNIQTIFKGYIYEAYSYKQGTEWITYIDGFDGLYDIQNSFTSKTVNKETSQKDVVKTVLNDMPNIIKGIMGSPTDGEGSGRGQALFGKSNDVMKMITNNQYFIDSGTAHIMADGEYFGDSVILLDSEQLLTTPRRRETLLDVEVLLLPEATLGVVFQVQSKETLYNQQYVCLGIKHHFEWSGASCGQSKTTISLNLGAAGLKKVV